MPLRVSKWLLLALAFVAFPVAPAPNSGATEPGWTNGSPLEHSRHAHLVQLGELESAEAEVENEADDASTLDLDCTLQDLFELRTHASLERTRLPTRDTLASQWTFVANFARGPPLAS